MSEELLRMSLCLAVPLWIEQVRERDWAYRLRRAQECAQVLASEGDKILYKTPSKRRKDGTRTRGTAEAFNHLAEGLACLAFCPGGVTFLGEHFEVQDDAEPSTFTCGACELVCGEDQRSVSPYFDICEACYDGGLGPTFVCEICGKDAHWEEGCDDDMPNSCALCWCAAQDDGRVRMLQVLQARIGVGRRHAK